MNGKLAAGRATCSRVSNISDILDDQWTAYDVLALLRHALASFAELLARKN